jgi:hypothetical protein
MRGKFFIWGQAVLYIGLLLFSCEPRQAVTDNRLGFDTISITRAHHLKNDSTLPSCNLRIRFIYPESSGDKKAAVLQKAFISRFLGDAYAEMNVYEAIGQYALNYAANYEKDAAIFFSDRKHAPEDESYPDVYFSYYETLTSEVTFNKAGIVAFSISRTNFKAGMSNSFRQVMNYVFNLKTGTLITEDTIFNEGYEKKLNDIFKQKLLAENHVETLDQLEKNGYFGIDEITPNGNFLLNENGITYLFNKGEYSAIQLNAITIFLPYKEIGFLIKAESPVSIFIN